jgi:hypothetical protein
MSSLNRHIKSDKCTGVDSLSCEHCKSKFETKQAKYKHKARGKCTSVTSNSYNTDNHSINHSYNTTNNTTNNNTTNNNSVIIKLCDFGKEDLDKIFQDNLAVKEMIVGVCVTVEKLENTIKTIWFNPNNPSCHNVKMKNHKTKDVSIYQHPGWVTRHEDDVKISILRSVESFLNSDPLTKLKDRNLSYPSTSEGQMMEMREHLRIDRETDILKRALRTMLMDFETVIRQPIRLPLMCEPTSDFFEVNKWEVDQFWSYHCSKEVNRIGNFCVRQLGMLLNAKSPKLCVIPRIDMRSIWFATEGKWRETSFQGFLAAVVEKGKRHGNIWRDRFLSYTAPDEGLKMIDDEWRRLEGDPFELAVDVREELRGVFLQLYPLIMIW